MSKVPQQKIPAFVVKKIMLALESPSKDGTKIPITVGTSIGSPKIDGFETIYTVIRDDRGGLNHRLFASYENPPGFWRETTVKRVVTAQPTVISQQPAAIADSQTRVPDQLTALQDQTALIFAEKPENIGNTATIKYGLHEGIFLDQSDTDLSLFSNNLKQYFQGEVEIFFPVVQRFVIFLFNPRNIIYAAISLLIVFYFQPPHKVPAKLWKTKKKHKKFFHWSFLLYPGFVFTPGYIRNKSREWNIPRYLIVYNLGFYRNLIIRTFSWLGRAMFFCSGFGVSFIVNQAFGFCLEVGLRSVLTFFSGLAPIAPAIFKKILFFRNSLICLIYYEYVKIGNNKICELIIIKYC